MLLAHEALRRLAALAARSAGVPPHAPLRFARGRWFVGREAAGRSWPSSAVWPEGHPSGDGSAWFECFDGIRRGAVFTVLFERHPEGCGAVTVTLTRDEVTGEAADALRRQCAERE